MGSSQGAQVNVKNVAQVRLTTDTNDPVGGAAASIKYVTTNVTDTGNSDNIVAAVTGKKITVLSVVLAGTSTGTVIFYSGDHTGTKISPTLTTQAVCQQFQSEFGLFQTASGAALSLVWGGTISAAGATIAYVQA